MKIFFLVEIHPSIHITNSLLGANCMWVWARTFSTTGKRQTRTLLISENITFTNDDVINYVIGPSSKNCPGPPYPLIRLCWYCRCFVTLVRDNEWEVLMRTRPLLRFASAYTNGVWPPLRPVSVAQKNKPSTMLSSNVQSIDFFMDCTAWQSWLMRQSNGCATPVTRDLVRPSSRLKITAQRIKER